MITPRVIAAALLTATVSIISLSACGARLPEPTELSDSDGRRAESWSEIFAPEWQFSPQIEGPPLRKTGLLAVDSSGRIFLPDARNGRIVSFEPPGEGQETLSIYPPVGDDWKVLRAIAVGGDDRLYVLDLTDEKMTVLVPPDYKEGRSFTVPVALADFVVTSRDEIAGYTPTSSRVGHLLTQDGRKLASVFEPNERMRKLYARIQTGGIAKGKEGDIFLLHPSSYLILRLTLDFEPVGQLVGRPGQEWQAAPPPLPAGLSPYEFNQEHQDWWSSSLHIDGIFSLGSDLIIITLFDGAIGRAGGSWANLYTIDGETEAEGLEVPQGGRIVGARGNLVFVAREAFMEDNGEIAPFRLHAYRLLQ